jgi:hypothetical protein
VHQVGTYDPAVSHSGDIAAWVQAIGTVLVVPVSVAAVIFAAKAFRAQSAQLRDQRDFSKQQSSVLALQAADLEAAHADRERGQRNVAGRRLSRCS